jgi:hypothetical protein
MTLHGRGQPNPKQYRERLEKVLTLEELKQLFDELTGGKSE